MAESLGAITTAYYEDNPTHFRAGLGGPGHWPPAHEAAAPQKGQWALPKFQSAREHRPPDETQFRRDSRKLTYLTFSHFISQTGGLCIDFLDQNQAPEAH